MLLAAALIALFFNGIAFLVHRLTKWPHWLCLSIGFVVVIALTALASWFIGYRIQDQLVTLTDSFPGYIETAKTKISQSPVGKKILEYATSDKSVAKVKVFSENFLSGILSAAGNLYVIIFVAMFFTISPKVYYTGFIKLIPKGGQAKAETILHSMAMELSKWIKGKLFAMLVVFILTTIGLLILDIPMPLALALIAGLLNFIPNFGPVIGMIPAVLITLPMGNNIALMVAGLYIAIQVIESNFITPLVQQKLVKIPPALIITGQVIMGLLTGALGLLLATPIIVILMILVKNLYLSKEKSKQ